jgi:hypothetical protein
MKETTLHNLADSLELTVNSLIAHEHGGYDIVDPETILRHLQAQLQEMANTARRAAEISDTKPGAVQEVNPFVTGHAM